jgi:hypothetical protein
MDTQIAQAANPAVQTGITAAAAKHTAAADCQLPGVHHMPNPQHWANRGRRHPPEA